MRCDTVRTALLDFSNGETGLVRTWAIRRHLAACADCTEELASLQQFRPPCAGPTLCRLITPRFLFQSAERRSAARLPPR